MPCKLMKKMGYVFDMQAYYKIRNWMLTCVVKLKGDVGGACKQRQEEHFRWHAVMTPDKPDIDFKLDGAK